MHANVDLRPQLIPEWTVPLWPIWNEGPADPRITELQDRLIEMDENAQTIRALCDKEKRDLTEDEQSQLDHIFAEFKRTKQDIERRQQIADQTAQLASSMGRLTTPEGPAEDEPEVQQPRNQGQPPPLPRRQTTRIEPVFTDRGKWGWRFEGEYYAAVVAAGRRGGPLDPRLEIRNAPTTYGQEGVGADGGFAVPPDFRAPIISKLMTETSLLSRTDQQTSTSNSITFPVDETTSWQTSGGIQAYWENEAGLKTQSKPLLQPLNVRLNKLIALVPVTDELLADAPAMGSYVQRKAPEKIDFKVTMALIQGNGAGQPLGLLNAPCLVSVAKENGQLADTIQVENIQKMYSRMYADWRNGAVWLINQDIEPQLFGMTVGLNNWPVYLPPNGLASAPFATLMGRPVIATQACETLGDKGDIIFVNLSQYLTVTQTAGLRQDISIHLWFDYDVTAFRFVMRIGGQPWLSAAISPRDGNNTLSSVVTLDDRA